MNQFRIIFLKEFRETIRDRRTLITMIAIPLLLYPILISVVTKVTEFTVEKASNKEHKVWVYGSEHDQVGFLDSIASTTNLNLEYKGTSEDIEAINFEHPDSIRSIIKEELTSVVLEIKPGFNDAILNGGMGKTKLYFITDEDANVGKSKLTSAIDKFKEYQVSQRFSALGIDEEARQVVFVSERDLATEREQQGNTVGGLIPYFFMLFALMGAMYPAIDLGAGEKERGTVDTLLILPTSPIVPLLSKLAVISISGLVSAMLSMVGIWLTIQQAGADFLPIDMGSIFEAITQPSTIFGLLLLLIPCTVLFAAGLLTISIHAKSFKEAQSTISPMMIVVFIPAVVGALPGVGLDWTTVGIPILNASLAIKKLIAGTLDIGWLILTTGVMLAYAGILLAICAKVFRKESVMVGR